MQKWSKLRWFNCDEEKVDGYNYAAVPVLVGPNEDKLIVTKRDSNGKSRPFLYHFDKDSSSFNPLSKKPILDLGKLGEFDEDGVMPVCSIIVNNKVYLYYIGWNLSVATPFRNSIGLAISDDNGNSFYKPYRGPILDRSIHDPCFVASCCVIRDGELFKMWYLSCDNWEIIDGKVSPKYNIKFATSIDAISWQREGKIAIDYFWENEYAISVPRVIKEYGIYKMWYSYRGKGQINTYRIGYAESINGLDWNRYDENIQLYVSATGPDSEMICYPFVFDYENERYMLYNGNGYGKTGFGIAKLENI